ncbi:MAG: DUF3048 C-terminal domain-containing protein, partial [Oscillospiraceae bacterium]|nr:DUF3048 C-terminal domain-containing protein [Oscillospiraceae bacterium]
VVDDYGRLSVDLEAEGEGYFVCGGKLVPITWEKKSCTEPFSFKNTDGTPLELGCGKTFVSIMPLSGTVAYE